jgi:hypothetical protein
METLHEEIFSYCSTYRDNEILLWCAESFMDSHRRLAWMASTRKMTKGVWKLSYSELRGMARMVRQSIVFSDVEVPSLASYNYGGA